MILDLLHKNFNFELKYMKKFRTISVLFFFLLFIFYHFNPLVNSDLGFPAEYRELITY